MLTAEDIIQLLGLKPHPKEGGYFKEIYRSDETIPLSCLPKRYTADKSFSTAIYYLLTPETFSAIHKLDTDEIFHFYLGDPVTLLQLLPNGSSQQLTLGSNIAKGEHLQLVVEKDVWQGSFLNEGGQFALLGTTVAPGFDFSGYTHGDREELIQKYPNEKDLITRLTRNN